MDNQTSQINKEPINLKGLVPWWLKICAKLIISRLPLRKTFLRGVGMFVHGKMDQPEYAFDSFEKHLLRLGLCEKDMRGSLILELGPGDSIATVLIAAAIGARASLVDVGPYAMRDTTFYKNLNNFLIKIGRHPPDISRSENLEDILNACSGEYLTCGIAGLNRIQDATVDYVFSRAVLEHIRRYEFKQTMSELYRVLKPGGACSHAVDLKDHLGGKKNNLRIGNRVWESDFFAGSGFYTNRIQFTEMIGYFKEIGFLIENVAVRSWENSPLDRKKISSDLKSISDKDMLIKSFDIVLIKN
jgi:SAM-dependent methyltransferase